jgi:hypothetical protein
MDFVITVLLSSHRPGSLLDEERLSLSHCGEHRSAALDARQLRDVRRSSVGG